MNYFQNTPKVKSNQVDQQPILGDKLDADFQIPQGDQLGSNIQIPQGDQLASNAQVPQGDELTVDFQKEQEQDYLTNYIGLINNDRWSSSN